MKKRILSLCLATMVVATATTAWVSNLTASAESAENKEVVLCDFEKMNPDVTNLRVGDGLWSLTRSTEYATSGKYSLKVVPGAYFDNSVPYFIVPLTSAYYGFNYNVSEYISMTAKVYNEKTTNVKMKVGISTTAMGRCLSTEYELSPGWNDVLYSFNHSLIMMYNGSLEDIPGIYFEFTSCGTRNLADSDVVYIDEIKLNPLDGEVKITDVVKLDPYEICDFEKSYQQYVIGWDVYADTPPETKIVDVRKGELPDGVLPTSGFRCLQVETHPRTSGSATYPKLILKNYVIEKAVKALTEEEKQRAYICLDIYSKDVTWNFDTGFIDSKNGAMNSLQIATTLFWGPTCPKGEWKHVRYKLTDIDAPKGDKGSKTAEFMQYPDSMCLSWPDYFTGENRTFYLDNVRIELE
ncbi:MAG: hypothetical protein E7343_05090 [Clostridiales bacterium]|nr:hypothetical protein [Clostridiales bacterium]